MHFDVDVVDFNDAQLSEDAVRGDGLTLDAAMRALTVLTASERLSAVTVTELNPFHGDEEGRDAETVRRACSRTLWRVTRATSASASARVCAPGSASARPRSWSGSPSAWSPSRVMGSVAPIVMSAFVFAGASQFGATSVLASGGSALTAIATGAMLNARFLPMGVAAAAALRGGRLRRALEGQAIVDASWALAARGEGGFDREALLGGTLPQYPAWVLGTVVGVVIGDALGDPERIRPRRHLPGVLPRAARGRAAAAARRRRRC